MAASVSDRVVSKWNLCPKKLVLSRRTGSGADLGVEENQQRATEVLPPEEKMVENWPRSKPTWL